MRSPYLASEDSALLRSTLSAYSGESSLEIGAGNGGNLIELAKSFGRVVGTDIMSPDISDWKGARVDFLLADAASCLRNGSFDLVIFNPPYLPVGGGDDVAVEGGEGLEVPIKFLREALRTVKKSGRVVFLLNSQAPSAVFEVECAQVGFALRKVASRHLFFEELVAYEASAYQAAPAMAEASREPTASRRLSRSRYLRRAVCTRCQLLLRSWSAGVGPRVCRA